MGSCLLYLLEKALFLMLFFFLIGVVAVCAFCAIYWFLVVVCTPEMCGIMPH